ncbi:hypothetical protein BC826DRAFT_475611 [Russula brevipes]|nr:hypothetical protein BC826DRAFT_475611 [Russula brevipes]
MDKNLSAMGPEFEPYLPVVMPPLFRAVNTKADIPVYEDEDVPESKEGWDIIEVDGQQVGIRTSAIDEKCQAFETLVIYCSTWMAFAKRAPLFCQCWSHAAKRETRLTGTW